MRKNLAALFYLIFLISLSSFGGESPYSERIKNIRSQSLALEQQLVDGLKSQSKAKENIKKIQTLLKLQSKELALGRERLAQLKNTLSELNLRKGEIREKILVQSRQLHQRLLELHRSSLSINQMRSYDLFEAEKTDAPLRKVLASLSVKGLSEIETLKADATDAEQLEARIGTEQNELGFVVQELKEQEGILELNRQMQAQVLKKHVLDRTEQIERLHKLRSTEAEVQNLVTKFNARMEIKKNLNEEKVTSDFALLKGSLKPPVAGPVLSHFGRVFDPRTSLYIFKKGIEIDAKKALSVSAIGSGTVVFAGPMSGYGNVVIVDHGGQYYSLIAKLGRIEKQVGQGVTAGDKIGEVDKSQNQIYFEIRNKNIAIDPLPWLAKKGDFQG